jgi:hypothetical protein
MGHPVSGESNRLGSTCNQPDWSVNKWVLEHFSQHVSRPLDVDGLTYFVTGRLQKDAVLQPHRP